MSLNLTAYCELQENSNSPECALFASFTSVSSWMYIVFMESGLGFCSDFGMRRRQCSNAMNSLSMNFLSDLSRRKNGTTSSRYYFLAWCEIISPCLSKFFLTIMWFVLSTQEIDTIHTSISGVAEGVNVFFLLFAVRSWNSFIALIRQSTNGTVIPLSPLHNMNDDVINIQYIF